ncbi:hypothetical protein EDB85DRAFT_1907254 [Lactarius pseudohatsudake]|nr:hypothetical protein EDB85DRAFT_1907254 [Lactarius pseudohatsudake]
MTALSPSNSRGMGWRKPVPVFIPSPPVSRPTSDTVFTAPSVSAEGDESKSTPAGSSQHSPPPVPDNWGNVIRNVTHDVQRDSSRFQRGATSVIHEPEPAYVVSHFAQSAGLAWPLNDSPKGLSRTASSTMDDHRPRSRWVREASLPRTYRPPTPPIPSSARRPKSYAVPSQLESQTSLARPFRMIYPDPPSLIMKDSNQTLRRCSAPSLCLSESTRMPPSVNTRPSVQSLTSSDGHTAVSSHAGTGSWQNGTWDSQLTLQGEKKPAVGSKEANGQTDLPMHYVPASRLRKTTKRRSCSGMLWSAVTSFGQGIMSLFETKPMDH